MIGPKQNIIGFTNVSVFCLGILPQVLSKSLEYRCIGTISAFFLKIMLDLQKYKLDRVQCECGDIMAPEINRSEISLELILEFFF